MFDPFYCASPVHRIGGRRAGMSDYGKTVSAVTARRGDRRRDEEEKTMIRIIPGILLSLS